MATPYQFFGIFLVYAVSSLAVFIDEATASAFSAAVGIALCMQKNIIIGKGDPWWKQRARTCYSLPIANVVNVV